MASNDQGPASRRAILQASVGVLVAGVAQRASAQQKAAKTAVQYQEQPKDGHQCSACAQFEAPKSCKIVDGDISPSGWCALFAPKPA